MRNVLACLIIVVAQTAIAQQTKPAAAPINAVLESSQTLYRYQNDGTGEIVQSVRYRILTETGLRMLGEVFLPYSSQLEKLKIDYLRTVKPDGSEVSADPSKALDVTSPVTRYAPTFSDVRMKVLIPPQLQVGDSVEYQYTQSIVVAYMPGQFWVADYLKRAYPITSETVTLDVPAGRKLAFEADPCFQYTLTKKNGRAVYVWQISNLKPPKAVAAAAPPLFAASTLSDWKQVGDWYLGLQSNRTAVTPEISTLAKKLTAGMTAPEQKTDAIYTYVSEKIRYVALEFGIGGYQAHSASAVLASGYGDCKDKSGLLGTLLAAAGIKSFPVLVNALQSVLEPSVPMPSQFDHVMTVVPLGGKMLWLDSTMETAPPGVLSPLVRGKKGLLVDAGVSKLVPVPDEGPRPDEFDATVTGSLDPAGKLTLDGHLEVYGFVGAFMRTIFRLQDKNQVAKVMKAIARSQIPGAAVSGTSSSDPEDLSGPFKFQYVLTRDAFLDLLAQSDTWRVPDYTIAANHWSRPIARAEDEEKEAGKSGCAAPAEQNIKLGGPADYSQTVDILIPANYEVDLPVPVAVTRPFASYSSSYSFSHGHLVARRSLRVTAIKIPASALEDLENFQSLINGDLNQMVTLRRTGEGNILSSAGSMTTEELLSAGMEALVKHQNPVLARELFSQDVAKDPKSKYGWNNLGRADWAMGDYYEARKAYRKQIGLNAYDAYAYNNLGLLDMADGQYARGITEFKQQLSVNPLDPRANADLAGAYAAEHDWNDAATAASSVVRLNPSDSEVRVELGTDLLKAGKTDEGRSQMKRAFQLSKAPMILNNAAFGMAEAGVDLAQAEQDVGSAIDQVIPENVDSLEVSKDYAARIGSLGAFLDTLGWVLYKQGKLAAAKPYLEAAFEIQPSPAVAQHLAILSTRLNDPASARRYYSYSVARVEGAPMYTPPGLLDYLRSHGGVESMTPARAAIIQTELADLKSLTPPEGAGFTWPAGAGSEPAYVVETVLVDESGRVLDAHVYKGSEPYSTAASKDVTQLRFPPLAWPGHTLKTVRTAQFLYDPAATPGKRVLASWSFSSPPEVSQPSEQRKVDLGLLVSAIVRFIAEGDIPAAEQLMKQPSPDGARLEYPLLMAYGKAMRVGGNYQGAAALFRGAAAIQPKIDFAWRELAETLKKTGDVAGSIEAYQKAVNLEPSDAGYHYWLGSEYELAAQAEPLNAGHKHKRKKKRRGKGKPTAPSNLDLALAQYAAAAKIEPSNTVYATAYATLYQKINHVPPTL